MIQRLTVHHLAMNRIAQRRDITDDKVIAEFASMVETVSGLEQLYLSRLPIPRRLDRMSGIRGSARC